MNSRRWLALSGAGLLGLNWLVLAVMNPDRPGGPFGRIAVGYLLGTIFGQTTLAAAWAAFGPGRLMWRLAGSLLWIAALVLAICINMGLYDGPSITTAIMIGLCLLGQWMLLQVPLWCLVIGHRLHLRHTDAEQVKFDPSERQFGIGQLIAVTAVIGVSLGIGRAIVTMFGEKFDVLDRETPIFIFLAVAAAVLTLPLLLALLLNRRMVLAVAWAVIFNAVMTAFELPLLKTVIRGTGPEAADFIWLNLFAGLSIVVISAMVRRSGYFLSRSPPMAAA